MGDLVATHMWVLVGKGALVCSRQTGLLLSNHTALCQVEYAAVLSPSRWLKLEAYNNPQNCPTNLVLQFPFCKLWGSISISKSWFFMIFLGNHFLPWFLHLSFLSFFNSVVSHRSSFESMPLNSRQVAFCRGFRSQTIWNTRGNENLGTDHPKSDPQTRPEIRRGSGAHFFHSNFILWVTPQHHLWDAFDKRFCGTTATLFLKKKNTCNDENPVICLTPMVPEALVALETDRKIGWHEPAG